jgi:hypothetical protein
MKMNQNYSEETKTQLIQDAISIARDDIERRFVVRLWMQLYKPQLEIPKIDIHEVERRMNGDGIPYDWIDLNW